MNTRDKIHSAINEHIDIEDTYAYFLTREKSSFSVGTVTLDDFEEWTDSDVADLTDSIMEKINPELNENQQVVLEWLKKKYKTTDIEPIELIWRLRVNSNSDKWRLQPPYKNYRYLTEIAQFQLLVAFAEWGMKQC
ncbi:hypothetical protein [Enterococcus avium]|jgi:hypothetical protein|uniref:hypothetical protein n=1 Tax=Enterococcus avium TaxID=33945 RepID=UPI0028908853|nr:hypothetical protein [Enterococcus avium]MDT2472833.1 hypothetical protein [Enterococcus avium]